MQRNKKVRHLAKKLVELSKDEKGLVVESRVREVLDGLKQASLRRYLGTLKAYLQLMRREIALQTALVGSPTKIADEALRQIEHSFSERYERDIQAVVREDPSLIAGVRIRVGDDVYDASVAGQLERLADNVR